jgi:hypothetical protein
MNTAAETPQWDVRAPQVDVHGSSIDHNPQLTHQPEHPSGMSALMDNIVTQQSLACNVEGDGHLDRREYLHATAASKAAA